MAGLRRPVGGLSASEGGEGADDVGRRLSGQERADDGDENAKAMGGRKIEPADVRA